MSVYLTIFSKLRYLGLVEIDKNKAESVNLNNSADCVNCENCHDNVNNLAVINTMRGLELGILHGALSPEQQNRYEKFCLEDNAEQLKGPEPMLQKVDFVRFATPDDIKESEKCRQGEEYALVKAREILTAHNLLMKLVDVEYVLDRKKLFFYFTSDQRVDFRAYVRDLAREFRTRIEMRQIGVRDESRAVKGIASCGRPCCCSYWLHHFTPIAMKMVKEQKLALSPTKISGICGRLMCCISYEQPNYETLWDKLPPPGTKIKSGEDFYTLESVELGTERVNIRFPSGQIVPVAIKDFENFNAIVTSGGEWETEGLSAQFDDNNNLDDAYDVNKDKYESVIKGSRSLNDNRHFRDTKEGKKFKGLKDFNNNKESNTKELKVNKNIKDIKSVKNDVNSAVKAVNSKNSNKHKKGKYKNNRKKEESI